MAKRTYDDEVENNENNEAFEEEEYIEPVESDDDNFGEESDEMHETTPKNTESKIVKSKQKPVTKSPTKLAAKSLNKAELKSARKSHHKLEHDSDKYASDNESGLFGDKIMWAIFAVAIIILFNGFLLVNLASSLTGGGGVVSSIAAIGGGGGSLDGTTTVGPALTALIGQDAVLPGYKTRFIKMETISDIQVKASTGDRVQDAISMLIPTGTPFYGAEAGVSFDDPINSLNTWGKHERNIKLTPELQARWEKIVGSFTCDFCCGSPQSPTIINRCGCSHAAAWRGIAKWMLNKYGDKYTDAQIMGEMTRWKALFYPGPMVKRAIEEGVL